MKRWVLILVGHRPNIIVAMDWTDFDDDNQATIMLNMKEPWCLAASTTTQTAKQLMTTYAKRWGIEFGFRDTKDLRFGMGMASIRVSTPERRDRLWLLNAFAVVLLTVLGATGEALVTTVIPSPIPRNSERIRCFVRAPCAMNLYQ